MDPIQPTSPTEDVNVTPPSVPPVSEPMPPVAPLVNPLPVPEEPVTDTPVVPPAPVTPPAPVEPQEGEEPATPPSSNPMM